MLRETAVMNVNAVDIEHRSEGRDSSRLFVVTSRYYHNRSLLLHLYENEVLIVIYYSSSLSLPLDIIYLTRKSRLIHIFIFERDKY